MPDTPIHPDVLPPTPAQQYAQEGKQLLFNSVRNITYNLFYAKDYLTSDERTMLAKDLTKAVVDLLGQEDKEVPSELADS